MNTEKKIMKKKRGIGWVAASLIVGVGVASIGVQTASAAEWQANTVESISQRLEEDIKDDGLYTIVWGDTLGAISQASGITIADLADANKIENVDLIYAGDTLIIDRDAVAELIKKDSYINYKDTTVDAKTGNAKLSEPEKYNNQSEKPSELNKDLFEDMQKEVNKEAASNGEEAPKPIETPEETTVEAPEETTVETPEETTVETPEETTVETPEETTAETPEETTAETPEETPEETPVETPEETTVETPEETPVETPEETPGESSEVSVEEGPEVPVDEVPEDGETTEVVEPGGDPTVNEEIVDEETETPVETPEIPVDELPSEEIIDEDTSTSVEELPDVVTPGEQTTEKVPVLDESGNPVLDENGNPVFEEVPVEGEPIVEDGGVRETVTNTQTRRINPGVQYIEDPTLEVGTEVVVQEGVAGVENIITTTVYENGVVVDTYSETVTVSNVQDKVVHVGTKPVDVVTYKTITRTIETPFNTVKRTNPKLQKGVEKVVQDGVNGVKEEQYKQTFVNGVMTSEEFLAVLSESAPVNKIIEIGTAPVVTQKEVYKTVSKDLGVVTKSDNTMLKGETREVPGKPEITKITYVQRFEDGVLVSEKEVSREIVDAGKQTIKYVGTKDPSPVVEDDVMKKDWSSFMPEVGDVIVKDSQLVIDESTMTVTAGDPIKYEITSVDLSDNLTGKTLEDMKNDVDKDSKAETDNRTYKNTVVAKLTDADGNDLGRWRYGSGGLSDELVEAFNNNQTIDTTLLNQLFVNKVNEERATLGKAPIKYETNKKMNQIVEDRTEIQAVENGHLRGYNLETGEYYGAHMLPNGEDWRSVYDDDFYVNENLFISGENIAETTWSGNPYQLVSEKYLADSFYDMWKTSPGHYKAMMGDYDSLVFSVKVGSNAASSGGLFAPFIGTTVFAKQIPTN